MKNVPSQYFDKEIKLPTRVDKALAWLFFSRDKWKEKCKVSKLQLKRQTLAVKRLKQGRNEWKLSNLRLKYELDNHKQLLSSLQQRVEELEALVEDQKREIHGVKKKALIYNETSKSERHSYPTDTVFLAMKWKQTASMRFRSISSAFKVLCEENKIDRAPAHETCIQWDLKIGLHKLNRAKDASSDWCWIVDHVIAQGATKCFAIMGVRCDALKHRNNWTLSLQDLEPFGLIPMQRSTGEEVSKALHNVSQKTGIVPKSILSDRGSDLWLGIREFQKQIDGGIVTLYDVCHKIAREYEKLFGNDQDWNIFKEKANYAKKQLHCTSGVVFAPPAQRKKARYHNVDIIIKWATEIIHYDGKWDDKIYEKLKWVYDYEEQISTWSQWVEVGKHTREQVRESGFSLDTEGLIADRLSSLPMAESTHQLACDLLDFVSKESSQLSLGEKAPGTTEVIESLFGYFKHVKNGLWDKNGGIGRLILTMASRVGELTSELVKVALDTIHQTELVKWFGSYQIIKSH